MAGTRLYATSRKLKLNDLVQLHNAGVLYDNPAVIPSEFSQENAYGVSGSHPHP